LTKREAVRLARTARGELVRAMGQMRIPRQPRPYYISYMIRDEETWRIQAKYGGLKVDNHERTRHAFADVRVGSYRNDQLRDGGLDDNDKESESFGHVDLPFAGPLGALRHSLWRLTDARYREAVESLLHKRSHHLTYLDPNRHLVAFERRPAVVDVAWRPLPELDHDFWVDYVQRASRLLKRYREIKDSSVEFQAEHVSRVFVNSEGSLQVQCQAIWSVDCYLWLLTDKGDSIPWTLKHIVTDPAELPDVRAFQREIRATVAKLRRLAKAGTVRSFSGPVLLEPVPAGLLLHEAVGHRLEGNRLLAAGEGQTFKDSLGQPVLPPFLSMRDDPTLESFEGRSLVGHYLYDDEGVASQNTELVRRGKLVQFLSTRTGIRPRHHSSGHARAAYHQRPISRMGTLIVEADNGLGDAALKRVLLEEIRRQGVPYGIRIVDATSGETATDAYNFQAFLGEANLATKVYPDGREEWIRGVNFVGTPLNAIRHIVAAGNRLEVDNAFCGAESGDVPVSTISPALVVSSLELQSKADSAFNPFTFPMP